jgi:hypothetical protein
MECPLIGKSSKATFFSVALFGLVLSPSIWGNPPEEAGTVALVSGKAFLRHGDVTLTDGKPEARFHDNYEKELGPNDPVYSGDVVITKTDSALKIYFKDDSIMDVGPDSTFKIDQFYQGSKSRTVSFKMLYGKIRTLVTRALQHGSSFRVATAVGTMGVRGTEWVTHAYLDRNTYKTDVTVLEGKVVIDVQKMGISGKIITVPVVVTPGQSFSGSGLQGVVQRYNVTRLTAPQLEHVASIVPQTETSHGGVAGVPASAKIAGTGVIDNSGKGSKNGGRSPASNDAPASNFTAQSGVRPSPVDQPNSQQFAGSIQTLPHDLSNGAWQNLPRPPPALAPPPAPPPPPPPANAPVGHAAQ